MRGLAIALLLAACGAPSSMPDIDAGPATLATADLGQGVDAAARPKDAAQPAVDAAEAPHDLAPTPDLAQCGQLNGPCCNAQVCIDANFPEGAYCTAGCALAGTWSGCRMKSGVPTCLPCGLAGQICCAASPRCSGGTTCAGPASANAGYCP